MAWDVFRLSPSVQWTRMALRTFYLQLRRLSPSTPWGPHGATTIRLSPSVQWTRMALSDTIEVDLGATQPLFFNAHWHPTVRALVQASSRVNR